MLQKNKIFLSLLGSFYTDTANTDFSNRLDYIYTSIIFNRYADTLRSTVLATDNSSVPSSVNFGFIDAAEINPTTRKIVVRDINNSVVENIDFVSIMFLDIEVFYAINDGVVATEAISAFASTSYSKIPVTYVKNVERDIFRNGVFRFVDNMDTMDFNKIRNASLRIVSDQIVYYPETLKLMHRLSNILLGAIYATDFEQVLQVTNNLVVTTKNTYSLTGLNEGKAIVSVGQEISPSSLITMLATVSTDIAFLDDITKMTSYVNSISPSFSNTVFLRKLSASVAKRKAAVIIPTSVFSSVDIEVITTINSIFRLAATIDTHATSGIFDSDTISPSSNSLMLIEESSTINVSIIGLWDITLQEDANMNVEFGDKIIVDDEMETGFGLDLALDLEPVLDYSEASVGDSVVAILLGKETVIGTENEDVMGLYVDTNIASVSNKHASLHTILDNIPVEDGGPVYDNITVSTGDTVALKEDTSKNVSYKKVMAVILGEHLSSISREIDALSVTSAMGGDVELNSSATFEAITVDTSIYANSSLVEAIEAQQLKELEIPVSDIFISTDNDIGYGSQKDVANIDVNIAEGSLISTVSSILLIDESDVEGENTIDA